MTTTLITDTCACCGKTQQFTELRIDPSLKHTVRYICTDLDSCLERSRKDDAKKEIYKIVATLNKVALDVFPKDKSKVIKIGDTLLTIASSLEDD